MSRKFALLAVTIVFCFAALAQQPQSSPQPESSPQPQPSPHPQPSPDPQTLPKVHIGSPGQGGVIGGIIDPAQSWHGRMNVSFKLKTDGSLDELHPYYQDPDSQRFATQEHPELEQRALENMRQWKYSPFLLEGRPVEVRTAVVLRFDFEEPASSLQWSLNAASPSSTAPTIGGAKLPYGLRSWVELDPETMNSLRLKYKAPDYPQMARIAHIQGDVLLRIRVDKEGRVADEKAVRGHPILIQSALDAVKNWQYKPVIVNGQPVEILAQVLISFHM